jgi:hypothetical protein
MCVPLSHEPIDVLSRVEDSDEQCDHPITGQVKALPQKPFFVSGSWPKLLSVYSVREEVDFRGCYSSLVELAFQVAANCHTSINLAEHVPMQATVHAAANSIKVVPRQASFCQRLQPEARCKYSYNGVGVVGTMAMQNIEIPSPAPEKGQQIPPVTEFPVLSAVTGFQSRDLETFNLGFFGKPRPPLRHKLYVVAAFAELFGQAHCLKGRSAVFGRKETAEHCDAEMVAFHRSLSWGWVEHPSLLMLRPSEVSCDFLHHYWTA